MPIYEYGCSKCGQQMEVMQKFSDPPITRCEKCNGRVKKLISQSTFHLKGTGWYVTDYASKRNVTDEKKEKPKEEKKAKKTETTKQKVSSPSSKKVKDK
ncbi:FmdB family zinc ribbon protein [Thermodesulfobacteriota bacterium]